MNELNSNFVSKKTLFIKSRKYAGKSTIGTLIVERHRYLPGNSKNLKTRDRKDKVVVPYEKVDKVPRSIDLSILFSRGVTSSYVGVALHSGFAKKSLAVLRP